MQTITRHKGYKECPKCLKKLGEVFAHTEMRRDYANDNMGMNVPMEEQTMAYKQVGCFTCLSCKHYWEKIGNA